MNDTHRILCPLCDRQLDRIPHPLPYVADKRFECETCRISVWAVTDHEAALKLTALTGAECKLEKVRESEPRFGCFRLVAILLVLLFNVLLIGACCVAIFPRH